MQGHIVQGYIVPFSTTKSKVTLIKNCSPKLFYNMPNSFPEITFYVRPLRATSSKNVLLLHSLPPSLGTGLIGPGTEYILLYEGNPISLVFQNIYPPSPSPPGESVLPPQQRRGTRRAERGMGGQYFGRREKQDCPLTVKYVLCGSRHLDHTSLKTFQVVIKTPFAPVSYNASQFIKVTYISIKFKFFQDYWLTLHWPNEAVT